MTAHSKHLDYIRQGRMDRLLKELDHDPYHSKRKVKESTRCPDCGAVFHKGRWSWAATVTHEHEQLCPACHRIHDRVPAGYLTLSGDFLAQHKEEVTHLVSNYVERERAEHPLKRLMGSEEKGGTIVYTFTDAHLARGIGEALYHAYEGDLDYHHTKEDIMLRVTWAR